LLKNLSIKFRARYKYGLKQIGSLRVRPCFSLAGALPDPVRVVSTIRA